MKNKSLLVDAKNYTKEHIKKQNWLKVVTILASIVVFVTTYALIIPAITMEKTLICDIEEHEHTKACYDEKGELTCKKREHIHTESCYDAPNGKIVYTIESEPATDGTIAVISGNIPKNAVAKIEPLKLTKNEVREYLDSKAKDKLIEYVAYDIKIYVNDEEWQPDESVNVVIKKANIQLNEDESINVAHVDDKTDEISQMLVEIDKSGDIIFETNGFSTYIIYTVEFEYNNYHYSIFGGSEIKLSRLLKLLGIDIEVDNVKSVAFSNDDLINVEKSNDDWNIVTLHHFSTEEHLTIELKNNGKIVINVTDDYTEIPQDGEWYLVKTSASELQPGDQVLILTGTEDYILYSGDNAAWSDPYSIKTLYEDEYTGTIEPFQFNGKTYYSYDSHMQNIMSTWSYLVTISDNMGLMNSNGKYLNLSFNPFNGDFDAFKNTAAGTINANETISAVINGQTYYLTFNPNESDPWYGFIPRRSNDSGYSSQSAQLAFYRIEQYIAPEPEEPEEPEGPTPQEGEYYLVETPASKLKPGDQVIVANGTENHIIWSQDDSVYADDFSFLFYDGAGFYPVDPILYNGAKYYLYPGIIEQSVEYNDYLLTVSSDMGLMNCNSKYLNLSSNNISFQNTSAAKINSNNTILYTSGGSSYYLTNSDSDEYFTRSTNANNSQLVFYKLEMYTTSGQEEPDDPVEDTYEMVGSDATISDIDFTYRVMESDVYLYHTNTPVEYTTPFSNQSNNIIEYRNAFSYQNNNYNICVKITSLDSDTSQLYWGTKTYSDESGFISIGQFRDTSALVDASTDWELYLRQPETDIEWELWLEDSNGNIVTSIPIAAGAVYSAQNEYINVYSSNNTIYSNIPDYIEYVPVESAWHTNDDIANDYRDYIIGLPDNSGKIKGTYRKGWTDAGCEISVGTVGNEQLQKYSFKITKDVVGISTNEKFQFLATINDGRFVEDDSYTILSNGSVEFELGDDDSISLKVTEDSTVIISELNYDGYYTKFTDESRSYQKISTTDSFVINSDNMEITVVNTPGVKLPDTGGKGITFVYKIGMFLVVSSMICYFIAKKRLKK